MDSTRELRSRSENIKDNYCANCIKPFVQGNSTDMKMCNLILPPSETKSGKISIVESVEQIFQTTIPRPGTLNMCLSCTSTLSSLYKLYKKFTDTTVTNSELHNIVKEAQSRKSRSSIPVTTRQTRSSKNLRGTSHSSDKWRNDTRDDDMSGDDYYEDSSFHDDNSSSYPTTTILPNIHLDKTLTYRQILEIQRNKAEDDKTQTYQNKKALLKNMEDPTTCTYANHDPLGNNHLKITALKRGSKICPFCQFKFKSMVDLHEHLLHIAKIETYRCPYPDCNEVFAWVLFFAKHLAKTHSELLYVRGCEKCPATFYTNYELVTHESNHEETFEPDFDCYEIMCAAAASNPKKRKKGSKTEETPKSIAYRCRFEDCEKIFTEKIYLKRHVDNVHEPPVMFKCDYCPWVFPKEGMLAEHSTLHTGELLFQCEQCDAKLNNKKSLENHIFHFHKKRSEGYLFNFKRKSEATDSVLKKHRCTKCDKSYDKRSYLEHHIRVVHDGLEGFACRVCGKFFGNDESRIKHEETTVHTEFSCEDCAKKFYVKVKFIEHTESHFPSVTIEEKTPEHICELCGKLFVTLLRLNRHKQQHDAKEKKVLDNLFLENDSN